MKVNDKVWTHNLNNMLAKVTFLVLPPTMLRVIIISIYISKQY